LTNDYFRYWPLWTTFVEDYLRKKPADLLPGPDERTPETFLLTTFAKSNTRLKLLFKNDKADAWKWENAHIANFKAFGLQQVAWMRYLFDINGIGVGGDANCLNACDVDRTSVGGAYQCNNGPSVRLLMDMHDDDAIYGNLALGQSGHYFSPNRQDQLNSWLKADPLPIAFSDAQLEKQCRQKFYLTLPNYNR
jgi:acyl-homoserine lactone acylase PvdQ